MGYRIAEAAELSGVPATAIRWYEDQGLLRRAARTANGYRTYDDRDIARLRFVNRLRALDLATEDLAALVELWDGDECAPVAEHLRDRVSDQLADTQQRIAALVALTGDLQQVLARLQHPPHDGPCVEGRCACLSDDEPTPPRTPLLPIADDGAEPELACTLHPDRMPDRMTDWQALLAQATGRTPVPGGVSLRFPVDLELSRELVRLASAEQSCCSFFGFTLQITADSIDLQVTGPPEAQPVITTVFGLPGDPFGDTDPRSRQEVPG